MLQHASTTTHTSSTPVYLNKFRLQHAQLYRNMKLPMWGLEFNPKYYNLYIQEHLIEIVRISSILTKGFGFELNPGM